MKKIVAIMTICVMSSMSFAQQKLNKERVSPEKRQEMKVQKMEAELELTP